MSSKSTRNHEYNELEECVICANRPSTLAQCCDSVRYCSDNCREADKTGYVLLCEQLKTLAPRPSPIHVRAIFLPQDEPQPRWIWVECKEMVEEDSERWRLAQVKLFLGPDNPYVDRRYIQVNAKRCYILADTAQLVFRDNALYDGSRANRSLAAALGQLGSMPYNWRGPIVAIRATGTSQTYRDMTLMDLRQTLDFFMSYDDETVVPFENPTIASHSAPTQPRQRSAGHVWGVQVNCKGERRLHRAEEYVAVEIPPHHPTNKPSHPSGDVPLISVLVGLPVRAWRIRDDNAYESRDWKEEDLRYDNRALTFLFVNVDALDGMWGWAPPRWNRQIGNVILVRDDGGDLSVGEARMLCEFCLDVLQNKFEAALQEPLTVEPRERVMNYVTPEKFEEYKEYLKEYLKELDGHGNEDGDGDFDDVDYYGEFD